MSMFALSALLLTPVLGQFPGGGGGKKGFGGGGNPFGGGGSPFGGGGNSFGGGGGGGAMGGILGDPSRTFDFLAKGRPYFLVTETRSLREPLQQYLTQKGISNGQVTREVFTQFSDQMKKTAGAASAAPTGSPFGAKGSFTPGAFGQPSTMFPTSPGGPGAASPFGGGEGFRGSRGNPLDMMNQWADSEFNRRDINGDGLLNSDEMPEAIKNDLVRTDMNHDQLIDVNEYRAYFMARMQGGGEGGRSGDPVTRILEEEFDKRPMVLRAGKLPKELKWFSDLDTNGDGQVALYEWRAGGKDMDEFPTHDRNDDGFITPEEALRMNVSRSKYGEQTSEDSTSRSSPFMIRGNEESPRFDFGKKNKENGGKKKKNMFGGN